jgi:hypothetical protein
MTQDCDIAVVFCMYCGCLPCPPADLAFLPFLRRKWPHADRILRTAPQFATGAKGAHRLAEAAAAEPQKRDFSM